MKAFLLALLIFLTSCKIETDIDYVFSPKGAAVLTPIPVFIEGQTQEQALDWLDQRIDLWIASHPELDPELLRSIAHGYYWKFIDHFRFASPWSSTGYAQGQIDYEWPYIMTSLYAQGESVTYPDYVPYSWMIEYRQNKWKYGVWPSNGIGFPSVAHELNHALDHYFGTNLHGHCTECQES